MTKLTRPILAQDPARSPVVLLSHRGEELLAHRAAGAWTAIAQSQALADLACERGWTVVYESGRAAPAPSASGSPAAPPPASPAPPAPVEAAPPVEAAAAPAVQPAVPSAVQVVLDGNVGNATRAIGSGAVDAHLDLLAQAEAAGKNRKGVLGAIGERRAALAA